MTRVGILSWDWREQPDISTLRRILAELGTLSVYEVDTGSDQHEILISETRLTGDEQEAARERAQAEQATIISLEEAG